MADHEKKPEATAEPRPEPDAAAEAADGVAETAAPLEAPSAEEFADMKDKLLRTFAEMENLRQRTAREIADARQYAVANFAREMLAVGDNLRRAIAAVPAELHDGGDKALAALLEGVEVTERGLEQALTKFGVKRIDAKGAKFDPSLHQAMFEVESEEAPPGTVADEIQVGYVIGERVLRPSLVAVAKKTAAAGEPAKGGEDAAKPAETPAASNKMG